MKNKSESEIYCYETEDGEICLKFGEAGIQFSKKRFLEFADKLNYIREAVRTEFLFEKDQRKSGIGSYQI